MRSRTSSLATLLLAACLAFTLFAPSGARGAPDPDPKAAEHTTTAARHAAETALSRAQAVFDGTAPAADRRAATMVLRELRMRMDNLARADRDAARVLLARPTGSQVKCDVHICVHWAASGAEAPDPADTSPANGTPDYIDTVLATVESVHATYVDAGYRAPLADGTKGGNSLTDIYIRNLGDDGLYGYCDSDQSKPNDGSQGWDKWAYCALDNDYSSSEFPTNTPIENLQVTAAHEYFHAVQFAYDYSEDRWIVEATATWAEDELFDDVNDNRFYLKHGPLGHPNIALDTFDGLYHYGTWLYFRYLTEKFPAETGTLPTLVLALWKRLDGKTGSPDDYSLQGLNRVLANRGSTVNDTLGGFAVANRSPAASYEEGASYTKAPATAVSLTSSSRNPAAFTKKMDHLTSATVRYNVDTLGASFKLKLKFDLASTTRGAAALVTVILDDASRMTTSVTLDSTGAGSKAVSMASGNVAAVEVTLLNVSRRFDCWENFNTPAYSCGGIPTDDNLTQSVDPRAVAG